MTNVFDDELLRAVNLRFARVIMAAGAVIAVLVAALVILALRPKAPPYVLAIDNGRIVGMAQPFAGPQSLGRAMIQNQLEQFIYDARVISTNIPLELHNLEVVYAIARGQARKALDAYYRQDDDHDPRIQGYKGAWRDVHITRCLQQAQPDSFLIEWAETYHPANNGEAVRTNWQATITVATSEPDAANTLNPIGLYAVSLDWAPEGNAATITETGVPYAH